MASVSSSKISYHTGDEVSFEDIKERLFSLGFEKVDFVSSPGQFAIRGSLIDVFSYSSNYPYRISFWGDEIEEVAEMDPVTGKKQSVLSHVAIFPASHYVISKEKIDIACEKLEKEMRERVEFFKSEERYVEAQRILERTTFDIEMLKETGMCSGIENYSRYFDGREPGMRPFCLLDYFPSDFITFIDESHVTIPQIRAMYGGDHSRKSVLIDYGFRLPAAADNRPLKFEEFEQLTGQKVYVSATPAEYELEASQGLVVEQVVRPTGLLDPPIQVRPTEGQVDDLMEEIRIRVERDERVLVTTLTKRMAEELEKYFTRMGVRCRYIHSDVDTLERVEIIEDFKNGLFDVLVGVNLLREGLDIPTVSLVAILDADKEGFLRRGRALTQTAGRAARNVNGLVIMYADTITDSMQQTIYETDRRRSKQMEYNKLHGITPTQVGGRGNSLARKTGGRVSAANSYDDPHYIPDPSELGKGRISVGLGHDSFRDSNSAMKNGYVVADLAAVLQDPVIRAMDRKQVEKAAESAKENMKKASAALDFQAAAKYRDEMWALNEYLKVWKEK